MSDSSQLLIGSVFTRDEIHRLFGGSKQSYLPTKNGDVVCGCFDPRLNKRAPCEIDVGAGRIVEATAELLADERGTIPVFLKSATNNWKYVGEFTASAFSRKIEDLKSHTDRRRDAVGVLFLQELVEQRFDALPPDADELFAIEGAIQLRSHLARERSPHLAKIKRSECRAKNGQLVCEACGMVSSEIHHKLADIADAAFEVHHKLPLAEMPANSKTRIDDLAVLCAICHRMIHRTSPMMDVELFSKLRRPCEGSHEDCGKSDRSN